ncbi:DoxX family membrane protein [Agrococcus terreus]|uniref:DoxX family protein n=1 Tax=Agrococcus terreus TaxID=574649 RepID=UPI00384AF563
MAAPGSAPASRSRTGSVARTAVRVLLGAFLLLAGVGHLTFARAEFQAQVPPWLPLDPDLVVFASGIVELALGLALLVAPRRVRPLVGTVVAAFFVAVFPGNIAQWAEGRDGFGLDTDAARAIRLLFQPLLVVAALWSTGGWAAIRRRIRDRRR